MLGTLLYENSGSESPGLVLGWERLALDGTRATSSPSVGKALSGCPNLLHGSLELPELDAVLKWWVPHTLPTENVRLHILAMSQSKAAAPARTQNFDLLHIDLPVSSCEELLTCGLSRLPGSTCIAAAWVARAPSLQGGVVSLQVSRGGLPSASSALNIVIAPASSLPSRIPLETLEEQLVCEEAGRGAAIASATPLPWHACVLEGASPASSTNTASSALVLFMITNGISLWCVKVHRDGSISVTALVDPAHWYEDEEAVNEAKGSSKVREGLLRDVDWGSGAGDSLSASAQLHSWASLQAAIEEVQRKIAPSAHTSSSASKWTQFLKGRSRCHETKRGNCEPPPQRYLGLATVQHACSWFVLLRWDGLLEVYHAGVGEKMVPQWEGTSAGCFIPTCHVPLSGPLRSGCASCSLSASLDIASHTIDVVAVSTAPPLPQEDESAAAGALSTDVEVSWTCIPTNLKTASRHHRYGRERIALGQTIRITAPDARTRLAGWSVSTTSAHTSPTAADPASYSSRQLSLLWEICGHGSWSSSHLPAGVAGRVSLGALSEAGADPRETESSTTLLQLIDIHRGLRACPSSGEEDDDSGASGAPHAAAAPELSVAGPGRLFHSYGVPLDSIFTFEGVNRVLLSPYLDYHRVFALEEAIQNPESPFDAIIETLTLDKAEVDPRASENVGNSIAVASGMVFEPQFYVADVGLHLIPCDGPVVEREDVEEMLEAAASTEEEGVSKRCLSLVAFFSCLEALERCPNAAEGLHKFIKGILRGSSFSTETLLAQAEEGPQLEMDETLAARCFQPAQLKAGLLEVLTPPSLQQRALTVGEYSRCYVFHTVRRSLLSRLVFLSCLFLGWTSQVSGQETKRKDQDVQSFQDLQACGPVLAGGLNFIIAALASVSACGPDLAVFGARYAARSSLKSTPTSRPDGQSQASSLASYCQAALHAFLSPIYSFALTGMLSGATDAHSEMVERWPGQLAVEVGRQLYLCCPPTRASRLGSLRGKRAACAWSRLLQSRVPLLHHFLLLETLQAGRTNVTEELVKYCSAVCVGISRLPAEVAEGQALPAAELLLQYGFLCTDPSGSLTLFSAMNLDELNALMHRYPEVCPKLYTVGLLRRLVGPQGSGVLLASSSSIGTYFLSELLALRQCVELECEKRASAAAADCLALLTVQPALVELHVDVLLALALASWVDGELFYCFHHLENAYRLVAPHEAGDPSSSVLQRGRREELAGHVYRMAGQLIRRITRSACYMEKMERMLSLSPSLEGWLVALWSGEVRLLSGEVGKWEHRPVQHHYKHEETASVDVELQPCTAAALALHRFLLHRRAYGQCGRYFSELAKSVRLGGEMDGPNGPCTAALSSARLQLAGRFASLALHATEQINTISTGAKTAEEGASTSSNLPMGEVGPPLSRQDLLWLRLQVHLVSCELLLSRRLATGGLHSCHRKHGGSTSSSISHELRRALEASSGVWKGGKDQLESLRPVVEALCKAGQWTAAHRLSLLKEEADPSPSASATPWSCTVLQQWTLNLLSLSRLDTMEPGLFGDEEEWVPHACDEGAWEELIIAAGECSSLANQFLGLRTVLTIAFMTDYERTPPKVLAALRFLDPYSALQTLLLVYSAMESEVQGTVGGSGCEEECSGNEVIENDRVIQARRRACCVCIDAAQIAKEVLEAAVSGEEVPAAFSFTAGVFDPLARSLKYLSEAHPSLLRELDPKLTHRTVLQRLHEVLDSYSIA